MNYLCNGFSESMKRDPNMKQIPYSLTESEFKAILDNASFKSCIGHHNLADTLSKITGKEIIYNRTGITVNYDDLVILVSLNGRLPEHPKRVEYEGRLNYSLLRFEKQTLEDLTYSEEILKGLIEVEA